MDVSSTSSRVSFIANDPQKLLDLYASLGDLDGYIIQKKVNRYVSIVLTQVLNLEINVDVRF